MLKLRSPLKGILRRDFLLSFPSCRRRGGAKSSRFAHNLFRFSAQRPPSERGLHDPRADEARLVAEGPAARAVGKEHFAGAREAHRRIAESPCRIVFESYIPNMAIV